MNTLRRTVTACLTLGVLAAPRLMQAATDHSADGPFSRLDKPVPTEVPGKVEVIEFFWYGCPHCAKVEPHVEAWEAKLPADVAFRREHVIWSARPDTLTHAQIFATLRGLGILGQHQQAVFSAVHDEKVNFRDEKALSAWVTRRGIDRARFDAMYKSFGMQAQIARFKALTGTYGIDGVPTFIVNGKYSTEPHRAGGERQVIEVINRLIEQERAAAKR